MNRTGIEINEIVRRIGTRLVSRDEARTIIAEVASNPTLDISKHKSAAIDAATLRQELADASGTDVNDTFPGSYRPAHYRANTSGIEVIDVARLMSFSLGTAMKFLARTGSSTGIERSIERAIYYLEDAIEHQGEVGRHGNGGGVDWDHAPVDIESYLRGWRVIGGKYHEGHPVHTNITRAQRLCVEASESGADAGTLLNEARDLLELTLGQMLTHQEKRFRLHVDTDVCDSSIQSAEFFSEIAERSDVTVGYLPDGTSQEMRANLVYAGSSGKQNIWVTGTSPDASTRAFLARHENIIHTFVVEDSAMTSDHISVLRGMLR